MGAGDSVEDLGACVACLVGGVVLGKVRDDVAQAVREEEDLVEDTDGLLTHAACQGPPANGNGTKAVRHRTHLTAGEDGVGGRACGVCKCEYGRDESQALHDEEWKLTIHRTVVGDGGLSVSSPLPVQPEDFSIGEVHLVVSRDVLRHVVQLVALEPVLLPQVQHGVVLKHAWQVKVVRGVICRLKAEGTVLELAQAQVKVQVVHDSSVVQVMVVESTTIPGNQHVCLMLVDKRHELFDGLILSLTRADGDAVDR